MSVFMKVDGIDGDATEAGHTKWLRLLSVNMGVSRSISTPIGEGPNRESSLPMVSEVTIVRETDGASAQLFQEALIGAKGKAVQIDFVTAGNPGEIYLTYKLTNTLISSYSAGSSGDRPTEQLSLNFTKIEYSYKGTKDDRAAGGEKRASYDLATSKAG